jgi:hypothetical protein
MIQLSGFVLVFAIVALTGGYLFGFLSLDLYNTLLALVGIGGIVGLRNLINSSGYKTYIVAIGGALVVALHGFGLISQDVMVTVLSGVLGLFATTLKSAIAKTPVVGSALKEAEKE